MRVVSAVIVLSVLSAGKLFAEEPSPQAVVIRDVSIFDTKTGTMLPNHTVVVEGALIKDVGNAQSPVSVPVRARTIDGTGKYLIPGLIDAHVHLVHLADRTHVTGDEFLPLFLAAGVTSVRSTGDAIVAETGVEHYARTNPERCPKVVLASPLIDGSPPFHADVRWPLVDIGKVPAFIDDMAAWNVTTLKIYVGTPRNIGRAVIEMGHRRDMIVTAHLGVYSAQDAVEDGIDCLEHIWSVFNYSIPSDVAGRPDHRANLDLQNPKCQELISALAKRKVAVDPTLVVFRNMIYLHDLPEVQEHPDLALAPERMRKYWESYRKGAKLVPETRATR